MVSSLINACFMRGNHTRNSFYTATGASKRRRLSSAAPYRALLFGSDEFSCATLRALHKAKEGLLSQLTVVVPPDARTGRGMRTVHQPPLRLLAEELDLPTISLPKTLLKGWEPPEIFVRDAQSPSNLLLTASFGHLIPSRLLSLFQPLNALNVHPSLLPRYRGAAPIQYTIANGDTQTGVSVQELSKGKFDHGRILAQVKVDVPSDATFHSLEPTLADKGGELLVQVLRDLQTYQSRAWTQDPTLASLAPKIARDAGRVDWQRQSGAQLLQWQRGMGHQAPLFTSVTSPDGTSALLHLEVVGQSAGASAPRPSGTAWIDASSRKLHIACGEHGSSVVVIDRVKPAGGKWIHAWDWWNGQGRLVRYSDGTVKLE